MQDYTPPLPKHIPFYQFGNILKPIVFKFGKDYYCINNHRSKGQPFGYTKVGTPHLFFRTKHRGKKEYVPIGTIYKHREEVSFDDDGYFWHSIYPRLSKIAKNWLKHGGTDDLRWMFLPLYNAGIYDITQPFKSNIWSSFAIWDNWAKEAGIQSVTYFHEKEKTGLPTKWDLFNGQKLIIENYGNCYNIWSIKNADLSGRTHDTFQLSSVKVPKILLNSLSTKR